MAGRTSLQLVRHVINNSCNILTTLCNIRILRCNRSRECYRSASATVAGRTSLQLVRHVIHNLRELPMTDRVTIQDIARLAGVSKATVSRVINQKPDVDKETRERIMTIMDEHDFVPNVAASGLAGGRTHLLGVLLPSLTWPLMPQIMFGIGEFVDTTMYELVLYSMNQKQDYPVVLNRIVSSRMTTALLAIFPGKAKEHLLRLHEQDFPIVIVDDQDPPSSLPWVGTDHRAGAKAAVRHLIELGHRDIAHISGPRSYKVSQDRQAGYLEELQEAHIDVPPEFILEGDFKPPSGVVCGRKLLEGPKRPTAVFAGNDEMAYGVMKAAGDLGLRIPDDLSLVGFDDIGSAENMRPPLTTVRQPFNEMGQRSISLLLSLVEASRTRVPPPLHSMRGHGFDTPWVSPEPIRIQLPSTLVVRASTTSATVAVSVPTG
jgi:LacI family transcriptional regulator